MSVVASDVSPLNCHWVAWEHGLPVCTRPPHAHRQVTEGDCAICEFWDAGTPSHAEAGPRATAAPHPKPRVAQPVHDPLNRETCPRCNSHDIVLMHQDAVVRAFTCSICHQRWLATRPWPLLRDTRSRHGS